MPDQPADTPEQPIFETPAPAPRPAPQSKVFFLTAIALVLILAVVSFSMYVHKKHGLQNALAELNLASPDLTEVFGRQKLRLLVLGLDENYTTSYQMYTNAARSDTMLAVDIDLASHQVGIISIPRDLWVHIPKSGYGKINEAIADAGPLRSVKTVVDNLNFPPFDNYVVLRIDATKNLVNAIGGLDVNVEKDMDYDDSWGHLHIHLKKGPQHLNGEQAVGYLAVFCEQAGPPAESTHIRQRVCQI